MFRSLFILLVFSPTALHAASDVDAVRLIEQMEDDPVTFRLQTDGDPDTPLTVEGQVQKLVPWVISQLLGGREGEVQKHCGSLTQAMSDAQKEGLLQAWALLQIYLGSYGLCEVDAVSAHQQIRLLTQAKGWVEIEALAGAELGLALAESGQNQGFAILEAAAQLPRSHTLSPTIHTILQAYTATILGLQDQKTQALALQENLLKAENLDQRRYQKSVLQYTIASDLLTRDQPGDRQRARDLFQATLQLAITLHDDYMQALVETALSSIAFREQRHADAITSAKVALKIFERLQNPRWRGIAIFRLTQALIAKKQYAEAILFLNQADHIFSQDNKRARIALENFYADAYEGLGQAGEALRHHRLYARTNAEYLKQMGDEARLKQVTTLELDASEARNRELQRTNELQAERLQNAQRLKQLLMALAAGLLVISLLLVFSVIQTRKASDRKQKIRRILDHIDEGIVTIDAQMRIEPEYSHYLQIFLGETRNLSGLDALETILKQSLLEAEEQSMMREALRVALGEPRLAWDLNADKLPREIPFQGQPKRYAALHWVPIFDRMENLQSVLLGIRDISAQKILEAEITQTRAHSMDLQRELAEILDAGVKPVMPLLARTEACLAALHRGESLPPLLAELHTIKGIARGLNLHILSHATHDLETRLNQEKRIEALNIYQAVVRSYTELLQMFHLDRLPEKTLAPQLLHQALVPVFPALLQHLASHDRKISSLTVQDDVGNWDAAILAVLPDVLLHAFTNSVDHGYLLNQVARDLVFHLTARRTAEGRIEIRLNDQGSGLNRQRVEELATLRNFRPGPEQEIWDVLLLENVSTAVTISQTSGRGIGLAAIQDLIKPLDGRLRLRPAPAARGADLIVDFPSAA